jgi:hypothetical protein
MCQMVASRVPAVVLDSRLAKVPFDIWLDLRAALAGMFHVRYRLAQTFLTHLLDIDIKVY